MKRLNAIAPDTLNPLWWAWVQLGGNPFAKRNVEYVLWNRSMRAHHRNNESGDFYDWMASLVVNAKPNKTGFAVGPDHPDQDFRL